MKFLIKKISIIIISTILFLNINCKKEEVVNQAPDKPKYISPADNTTVYNIPGSIRWSCTDKENDKLTYDVFFGTQNPPALAVSATEKTYFTDFTLESQTTYYWKINVQDSHGNKTEGDIWTFTMSNFPPETPENPFPENNSLEQNPSTISWECTEPDGETLTYDIYFGTSDTPELIEQNYLENSYQLSELTGNQKYYWRIKAKDSYGNEITGPLWNFTTDFLGAKLISPEQNIDNAAWFPIFNWSGNNTESLSYDLYLGTNDNPELLTSDLTDTNYHHLEQLVKEQTYYWKVISKKTGGETAESLVWSFTVFGDPIFDSFTDARDGNTYQTVAIGSQTWMAENLKYNVTGSKVYDDDPLNEDIYGRLYNWEQIMNGEEASNENPSGVQGIAPEGWHIPSQTEWFKLINFIGGQDGTTTIYNIADKIKEEGTEHWNTANGTNESGFNALGSGQFDIFNGLGFVYLKLWTRFNSCTTIYGNSPQSYLILDNNEFRIITGRNDYISLRCVKN